jgi:hypothetical protein
MHDAWLCNRMYDMLLVYVHVRVNMHGIVVYDSHALAMEFVHVSYVAFMSLTPKCMNACMHAWVHAMHAFHHGT